MRASPSFPGQHASARTQDCNTRGGPPLAATHTRAPHSVTLLSHVCQALSLYPSVLAKTHDDCLGSERSAHQTAADTCSSLQRSQPTLPTAQLGSLKTRQLACTVAARVANLPAPAWKRTAPTATELRHTSGTVTSYVLVNLVRAQRAQSA